MTKVSVVIPAYNAAAFIRRTIDSVLAQSYRHFEVIVVDDGSPDDTADVVNGYGPPVRCIRQANAGDADARNTGITAAAGEWIAMLDHDDEWLPAKLQRQMHLLAEHPHLRWCCTNRYQTDGSRRTAVGDSEAIDRALAGRGYFDDFFPAHARGVCPIITSAMVVHREVFERVGLFDTRYPRASDLDMRWRIAYQFPAIGYVSEPLAICHLNVQDTVTKRLSLASKRGDEARRLIAEHLEMARKLGRLDALMPVAVRKLRTTLLTSIYHGFKDDARQTIGQFPGLFPWHWRCATYLLTTFPRFSSVSLQSLAYVAYKLRLQRQATRRWVFGRNLARPS